MIVNADGGVDQFEIPDALAGSSAAKKETIRDYGKLRAKKYTPYAQLFKDGVDRNEHFATLLRVDLVSTTVWTDDWKTDLFIFLTHTHPVFGFFRIRHHPLSMLDNLVIIVAGVFFCVCNSTKTSAGHTLCLWNPPGVSDENAIYCDQFPMGILDTMCSAMAIALFMLVVRTFLICKCFIRERRKTQVLCSRLGQVIAYLFVIGLGIVMIWYLLNRTVKFTTFLVNKLVAYCITLFLNLVMFVFRYPRERKAIAQAGGVEEYYAQTANLVTVLEKLQQRGAPKQVIIG